MSALQHVIGQVKEQCDVYPSYADGDAKFKLLEITRVSKEKLADIESGFRHLSHQNMISPEDENQQRTGCVIADGEEQKDTEDLTHVGRFFDNNGQNVLVYQSADSFRIAAMGAAANGYNHELEEGQTLHDGKLWNRQVMQVIIETAEDYSIGLLLTEKQHEVATKALAGYQSSYIVWMGEKLGPWAPRIPKRADAALTVVSVLIGVLGREAILRL